LAAQAKLAKTQVDIIIRHSQIIVSAVTLSLIQNAHLSISAGVIFSILEFVTVSLPRVSTRRLRVEPAAMNASQTGERGFLAVDGLPVAAIDVQ
jgi:hypothetical protein